MKKLIIILTLLVLLGCSVEQIKKVPGLDPDHHPTQQKRE